MRRIWLIVVAMACGLWTLHAAGQPASSPRYRILDTSKLDTLLKELTAVSVFGLRRAFQVAGAKTVIMSLWPVEDQATRQWMTTLYERRLMNKLSTADAVREASLAVLRQRRAKGVSAHPFIGWPSLPPATGARGAGEMTPLLLIPVP